MRSDLHTFRTGFPLSCSALAGASESGSADLSRSGRETPRRSHGPREASESQRLVYISKSGSSVPWSRFSFDKKRSKFIRSGSTTTLIDVLHARMTFSSLDLNETKVNPYASGGMLDDVGAVCLPSKYAPRARAMRHV